MTSKFITLVFILILGAPTLKAQDSIPLTKDTVVSPLRKANLFVQNKIGAPIKNFTKQMTQSLGKVKFDLKDKDVYLMGGMNFSKQNIRSGSFSSPFVYAVNQKNVFKPGFMGGVRLDGKYRSKHPYAIALTLNKYSTGTNYKEVNSLSPFVGGFSNFKAEDQMFNLNLSALYKKNIPLFKDTATYKFYFLAGPSLDLRMSGQSIDNQVRDNYRQLFLRAHFGLEFDNNSYYTLFFHYKQGIHSITKAPIQTNLNNFEMGMMIKAVDLF
jgi:hypothetical protein